MLTSDKGGQAGFVRVIVRGVASGIRRMDGGARVGSPLPTCLVRVTMWATEVLYTNDSGVILVRGLGSQRLKMPAEVSTTACHGAATVEDVRRKSAIL